LNIKKPVISIALTFFLGPGAGHIYLGKYKKGLALLAATFITGIFFFLDAAGNTANFTLAGQNPAGFLNDFYAAHPDTVFYFDVVFAAIWAYAFVDAFFESRPEDIPRVD